jgi:hypothetical protein
MLATLLLCSGDKPLTLQRSLQAACRSRLLATDGGAFWGLPFMDAICLSGYFVSSDRVVG